MSEGKNFMMSDELDGIIDPNPVMDFTFVQTKLDFIYVRQNIEFSIASASLVSLSIEQEKNTIDVRITLEDALIATTKFNIDKTCSLVLTKISKNLEYFPFDASIIHAIKSMKLYNIDNKTGVCTLGIDIS